MANFTAKVIKSSFVQQFQAVPSKVFPLLCPVREYEWVEFWQCEVLHSDSGVAEKNCVFRTRFSGDASDDVWVVSRYEPNAKIEFVRVNAHRAMTLAISLTDNGDGATRAVNEILLVGLTEQGNQSLEAMQQGFAFEMRLGEAMLNHYLATGRMLPMQDAAAAASQQE